MITFAFLLIALLLMVAAATAPAWWVSMGLIYLSMTMAWLFVVHLLNRPRWLLKKHDGSMSWLAWVIHGPYLACNGLVFHLYRCVSRQPAADEIVPWVFLGRRLTSAEAKRYLPPSSAVVDLTSEFAEPSSLGMREGYLSLPVLDATAPSLEQLQAAVAHMQQHHPARPVYVHCALGHGRSATVVAAFLIKEGLATSPQEAVALIQKQRPGAKLNRAQLAMLAQLAILP